MIEDVSDKTLKVLDGVVTLVAAALFIVLGGAFLIALRQVAGLSNEVSAVLLLATLLLLMGVVWVDRQLVLERERRR